MRAIAAGFLTVPVTCCLTAGALWVALPVTIQAQQNRSIAVSATEELPEAPQPVLSVAAGFQEPGPAQSPQSAASATTSSSSQPQDKPLSPDEERRQKADQQLKEQKRQRVLGIVPMFNTSYRGDAVALTGKEKIGLAFRSSIDPVTFAGTAIVAGLAEVYPDPNNSGFGWGPEGYFKRWGAAYLDSFDSTMIGNGILPALLRQDPRYFRLGRGSTTHRVLYAAAMTVVCKGDKSRRWQPNFSNVGGNLIAGTLSNLYYPDSDRSGWEQTISSALIVTAEGALGGMFQEFWPDISRKILKKDPTHGLDAQIRAEAAAKEDKEKKQPLPPAPK